jgi:hypothetical protein
MKRTIRHSLSLLSMAGIALASATLIRAQEAAPAAKEGETKAIDDMDWPQVFQAPGYEVAIYQPQIHEWEHFRKATARAAVAIKPEGSEDVHFGAMTMSAETIADFETRTVTFKERTLKDLRFPDAKNAEEAKRLRLVMTSILTPKKPLLVNLDRMLANVERTEAQERQADVSLAPPPIFYSSESAILVMFMGKPRLQPVKDTNLLFGVNTNWDVLMEPSSGNYFLLNGDHWLTTKDLEKGTWTSTDQLPADLSKLPDDENWKAVREQLKAKKADKAPNVILTFQPSELILTEGQPSYTPITGTLLLFVANTQEDLFLFNGRHYFLTAGRWFSAETLDGPWDAATESLPEEFQKIPQDHEKAYVLASVPGTADAEEAIIMAQIPQTATVNRDEAKLEVQYDGKPQFTAIEGTTVSYAANTPTDVFDVDSMYYACKSGIWFQSSSPNGPWVVCSNVPDVIYKIPASSPKHNVTYVHVYDSTPDKVTVGYTSGYSGSYVVRNALVFGAGLWLASEILDDWDDDHWHHWHYHYPPHYYGYGCGAHYNWYSGGYYRSGHAHYGPYGGAGRGAVYNPWTGAYARGGAAYGPRGSAFAREAYNPWTDTYAARAGASTPYGSWGRSVVLRDDEWARAGHRSNWKGTAYGFETSKGAAGVGINRRYGPDAFIGKSKKDDLYVGRNGNLYKRDDNGDWSKRGRGGWDNATLPNTRTRTNTTGNISNRSNATNRAGAVRPTPPKRPAQTRPSTPKRPTQARPSTSRRSTPQARPATRSSRPSTRSSTRRSTFKSNRSSSSQLKRDYQARQRGKASTQRSRSARSNRSSSSRSTGRTKRR